MTDEALSITVYYENDDFSVQSIIRELDDLEVAYEARRWDATSEDERARLGQAGGGSPVLPAVEINGELLTAPTAATVMSAIMHARSSGFYQ
ncbi:MAG TPA: hypothetical protein VFB34_01250 [Chloroflexota bacterium]|nr:hypothetical protein [Chloroflexota bacterium]